MTLSRETRAAVDRTVDGVLRSLFAPMIRVALEDVALGLLAEPPVLAADPEVRRAAARELLAASACWPDWTDAGGIDE